MLHSWAKVKLIVQAIGENQNVHDIEQDENQWKQKFENFVKVVNVHHSVVFLLLCSRVCDFVGGRVLVDCIVEDSFQHCHKNEEQPKEYPCINGLKDNSLLFKFFSFQLVI